MKQVHQISATGVAAMVNDGDSADSFSMIRGGHVDVAKDGFQVGEKAILANWAFRENHCVVRWTLGPVQRN